MWAAFSTYDDRDQDAYTHAADAFNGHGKLNMMPAGPLDFSRRLYAIRYSPYPTGPLYGVTMAFPGIEESRQMCLSWKTKHCVRIATCRPTSHLPSSVAATVSQFRTILDRACTSGKDILIVVHNDPRFGSPFPWLASMSSPSPGLTGRGYGSFLLIKNILAMTRMTIS